MRLVSGAARDLAELVAHGAFDSRLYSVLAATAIRVPSLREHREDVPDIANLTLSRMVEAKETPPRQFTTAALNALRNYDWPGNLLQLRERGAHARADLRRPSRSRRKRSAAPCPRRRPGRGAAHDLPFDLPLRERARRLRARLFRVPHRARRRQHQPRRRERRARAHAPLPQAEAARHQARAQERERRTQ